MTNLLHSSHLVVPDPHATPEADNRRFDWLGQAIVEWQPDKVICLGDLGDMPSLCPHHGKREAEGGRIRRDIEAVQDAQERLWRPLQQYNAQRKAWKERQYKPRTVLLGGNHDQDWVERAVEDHPSLEGFLTLDALEFHDWWDEYVEYKLPIEIDGIKYAHHLPAGVSGRPVGGTHAARQLLQKHHQSCTVGHSHVLDYKTHPRKGDNAHMHGLVAGCFFEHSPSYARRDVSDFWWRGLIWKKNVRHGDYTLSTISIEELGRQFA